MFSAKVPYPNQEMTDLYSHRGKYRSDLHPAKLRYESAFEESQGSYEITE